MRKPHAIGEMDKYRVLITETSAPNNVTKLQVQGIYVTRPGTVKLNHDGDGEDMILTELQYSLLMQAKELTITAGNVVTYYIQVIERNPPMKLSDLGDAYFATGNKGHVYVDKQAHIAKRGIAPNTLCGIPMLFTNYARGMGDGELSLCPACQEQYRHEQSNHG